MIGGVLSFLLLTGDMTSFFCIEAAKRLGRFARTDAEMTFLSSESLFSDAECSQRAELPANDPIYHMRPSQKYYIKDVGGCASFEKTGRWHSAFTGVYDLRVTGSDEKVTTLKNVRNTAQYVGCAFVNIGQGVNESVLDCASEAKAKEPEQ